MATTRYNAATRRRTLCGYMTAFYSGTEPATAPTPPPNEAPGLPVPQEQTLALTRPDTDTVTIGYLLVPFSLATKDENRGTITGSVILVGPVLTMAIGYATASFEALLSQSLQATRQGTGLLRGCCLAACHRLLATVSGFEYSRMAANPNPTICRVNPGGLSRVPGTLARGFDIVAV
eukprot:5050695-Amphidinium_carterae.1